MGAHVSNDAEKHKSICIKCGRKSTHKHMEGKCRGTVGRHRIGNRDETMVRAHDLWSIIDGERKRICFKTLRRIHFSHVVSPEHGVAGTARRYGTRLRSEKNVRNPCAQAQWRKKIGRQRA